MDMGERNLKNEKCIILLPLISSNFAIFSKTELHMQIRETVARLG